jgi:uncharacterized C2H2 Zn-finger protein
MNCCNILTDCGHSIFCTKCNAAFKTSQAHRDHVLKSHGITTNEMSGKDDLESQKSQSRKDLHEENKGGKLTIVTFK